MAKDAQKNVYLLCDYNRDGDSYRCVCSLALTVETLVAREGHAPGALCSGPPQLTRPRVRPSQLAVDQ